MRRISIRNLMVFVFLIAVGLAAAMAGAVPFAVVALSAATIGVVISRGRLRSFFLGCAAVGWISMLVAFGAGPNARLSWPTTRLILRVYEAINGPGPMAFTSPEEASRWVTQFAQDINRAVTDGHALISLILALAGGVIMGLLPRRRDRIQASN